MNRRSTWLLSAFAVVLAFAPITGCIFAADLINPAAIAAVGLDPNSINRPAGTVLVVFVNDTDQMATYAAFQQSDPTEVDTARSFQVGVDPNSNSNEVLSCPTGRISLGSPVLTGTGGVNISVQVGAVAVSYTGDAVLEGVDYLCGDLIEYRVSVILGGDPLADFEVTARVVPGR